MADPRASAPIVGKPTFHDIKPLPEFAPLNVAALIGGLGLILAVVVAYLLYRKFQKPAPPVKAAPPLSPEEQVRKELRELGALLRAGRIELREIGARLSLALRLYVEQILGFSASDMTSAEVNRQLPTKLRAALPTVPRERLDGLRESIHRIIRSCELLSFADDANQELLRHETDPEALLGLADEVISSLVIWLKKELERRASVVPVTSSGAAEQARTGSKV